MCKNLKIAVCGTGPVGNYIALRLHELKFNDVTVLEAGEIQNKSKVLLDSDYIFESPSMMPKGSHKVGGGGNFWFGRVGEFSELDFLPRPRLGLEGWPFKKSDLLGAYKEVRRLLNMRPMSDSEILTGLKDYTRPLTRDFELQVFQYIDPELLKNKFMILLNAQVFNLIQNCRVIQVIPSVAGYRLATLTQREGSVEEKGPFDVVFLATGCFQTTSIVYHSMHDLGVKGELIGKGLMEHFDLFIGDVIVSRSNAKMFKKICLDRNRFIENGKSRMGVALKPSHSISMQKEFLNVAFDVVPQTNHYRFSQPESTLSLILILFKILHFFDRVTKRCFRAIRELLGLLGLMSCRYSLWLKGEELPSELSKISFNNLKEVIYQHSISQETFFELHRVLNWFKETVNTLNLGEIKYFDYLGDISRLSKSYVNWHPSGTLRMGNDARTSICDEYLQVHNNPGLFISSSASFPTSSNANPTFTSLAVVERSLTKIAQNSCYYHK